MFNSLQVKEIVRLLAMNFSYREIQGRIRVSNGAITRIKQILADNQLTWKQVREMDDLEVMKTFYPRTQRKNCPLPDFEQMYDRVHTSKAPSTVLIEWENYIEENPDGYMYTQFKKYFHDWVVENKTPSDLKMTVHRNPGEILYMDWLCKSWHNQSYEKQKVMRSS